MSSENKDCNLTAIAQIFAFFALGLAVGSVVTKMLVRNFENQDPWNKPWIESSNPVSSTSVDFS